MAEARERDEDAAAAGEAGAVEGAEEPEDGAEEQSGKRLLDQDEIDGLLGQDGRGASKPASGTSVLVDNSIVSYERLPMLEVVFDRLVRIMTTSLRNFTSENVDVALDRIETLRFQDYLNSVPLPAMITVFRAVEWDNLGLLTIDSSLIYAIVDVLLGGRRGAAPMSFEGRPFTTIERSLVERTIALVLKDMSTAFEPLSKVEFRFERLETNPRFAAIARPTNAAILFNLRLEMEQRGGALQVLVPYATLEPVRDLLLQKFMGEKFGRDTIWETHLASEMLATRVELEALLEEQTIPLGDAMSLEVGTTLPLSVRSDTPITLRCGNVSLMRARIGRVGDRVAVRLLDGIDREGGQP